MLYLLYGLYRYRKLTEIRHEHDNLNVTSIYRTRMCNDDDWNYEKNMTVLRHEVD